MKLSKKLQKWAVLLLTAAMLLTMLSGCEREKTSLPTAGEEPTEEDPTEPPGPTPNELLSAAFESSMGDLRARFDASPLSRLTGLTGEGARTVEFDTALQEEDDLRLTGTLVADTATGMADLTVTIPDPGLAAKCHYDSEFIGVSMEKLFGDTRYYGLRPYGFVEQLEGTPFAKLLELDMEAVARLDEALASIPRGERPESAPLFDTFAQLALGYIVNADLTVDGESYSAVLPSGELVGLLREYVRRCPAVSDVLGDPEAIISSIEKDGVDTALTFTVSNERVRHITAEYNKAGGPVLLEAELYGDAGDLLRVTLEPYFNLELTMNEGVKMALDVVTDETSRTTLDWAADGTLKFITYSGDVTGLNLEGTLTVEGGVLGYDGIWFSGNRGDRNPITLTVTPGGEVKAPEETVSLAELTERDILRIIARTVIGLL